MHLNSHLFEQAALLRYEDEDIGRLLVVGEGRLHAVHEAVQLYHAGPGLARQPGLAVQSGALLCLCGTLQRERRHS